MLLTVIIPAFNCEKTITRAIKSTGVYSSNTTEVIVVNNGSTDNTEQIIKELADKNPNIIYAESASGVSNARNKGIKLASGRWVTFLDADDYFLDNSEFELEKYVSHLSDNTDIIFFNYSVNHSKIDLYSMTKDHQDINQLLSITLENPTKYLTVWGKLYHTKTLKKNNVQFDTTLSYSEDSEFLIRYLLSCKKFKFENRYLYNYCLSKNSTVRKYNPKMVDEYQKAIAKIKRDLASYSFLRKSYSIFVLMQLNLIMVHNVFIKPSNQMPQLKSMCKKEYIVEAFNVLRLRDIFTPRLTPLVLCKYHLYSLASFIYKLRVFQNKTKA